MRSRTEPILAMARPRGVIAHSSQFAIVRRASDRGSAEGDSEPGQAGNASRGHHDRCAKEPLDHRCTLTRAHEYSTSRTPPSLRILYCPHLSQALFVAQDSDHSGSFCCRCPRRYARTSSREAWRIRASFSVSTRETPWMRSVSLSKQTSRCAARKAAWSGTGTWRYSYYQPVQVVRRISTEC